MPKAPGVFFVISFSLRILIHSLIRARVKCIMNGYVMVVYGYYVCGCFVGIFFNDIEIKSYF